MQKIKQKVNSMEKKIIRSFHSVRNDIVKLENAYYDLYLKYKELAAKLDKLDDSQRRTLLEVLRR